MVAQSHHPIPRGHPLDGHHVERPLACIKKCGLNEDRTGCKGCGRSLEAIREAGLKNLEKGGSRA
jgi:hypothetical protein